MPRMKSGESSAQREGQVREFPIEARRRTLVVIAPDARPVEGSLAMRKLSALVVIR